MKKEFKVPRKLTVGTKQYAVVQQPKMVRPGALGHILYELGIISVATHSNITGRRLRQQAVSETLLHETVHAILHDMEHPLATNEKFVKAFAERLNGVIWSAKF